MNLKEIQNLIKFVAKSGASEVKLEMDDIKITIRTGGDSAGTTTQHAFWLQSQRVLLGGEKRGRGGSKERGGAWVEVRMNAC